MRRGAGCKRKDDQDPTGKASSSSTRVGISSLKQTRPVQAKLPRCLTRIDTTQMMSKEGLSSQETKTIPLDGDMTQHSPNRRRDPQGSPARRLFKA